MTEWPCPLQYFYLKTIALITKNSSRVNHFISSLVLLPLHGADFLQLFIFRSFYIESPFFFKNALDVYEGTFGHVKSNFSIKEWPSMVYFYLFLRITVYSNMRTPFTAPCIFRAQINSNRAFTVTFSDNFIFMLRPNFVIILKKCFWDTEHKPRKYDFPGATERR